MSSRTFIPVWDRAVTSIGAVARVARALTVCGMLVAPTASAVGATIYVNGETGNDAWDGLCEEWDGGSCGPKATIWGGLYVADWDDEVVLADGVYSGDLNGWIDLWGGVDLRSASGDPNLCIIDHEGLPGSGLGVWGPCLVEGVTITNASADGGAVYCFSQEENHPVFVNCVVSNSTELGVYCGGLSKPTFTGCVISGNGNGGVYCDCYGPSGATFEGCTISGNSGDGGVVCMWEDSSTFVDCEISENEDGGVRCGWETNAVLIDCIIRDNYAGPYPYVGGGGLRCSDFAVPTIVNCQISGNFDSGVYCTDNGNPLLINCAITGNVSCDNAGVYCWASDPVFVNCTISGNRPICGEYVDCGGLHCSDSAPTLINCILAGNLFEDMQVVGSSDPVVMYCLVEDGDGEWWFGEGCIDAEPDFVDPDGADNDPWTWEDNDYRLSSGSPCIDAGDSTALPADSLDLDDDGCVAEPTPVDLDGHGRFYNDDQIPETGVSDPPWTFACVDMGVYEYGSTAPPEESPCYGDLDCDGRPTFDDISLFVEALNYGPDGEGWPHECPWLNADCNADGTVDFDDIAAFVGLLG